MREKAFEDILNATEEVESTNLYQSLPLPVFRPIADNEMVFLDYVALAREGKFARLPYLLRNKIHESSFYRVAAYAANITMTEQMWREWEAADFTCFTAFEAD